MSVLSRISGFLSGIGSKEKPAPRVVVQLPDRLPPPLVGRLNGTRSFEARLVGKIRGRFPGAVLLKLEEHPFERVEVWCLRSEISAAKPGVSVAIGYLKIDGYVIKKATCALAAQGSRSH